MLADRLAGLLALAREKAVALDDRDLRAKAAERLRQLDADRAATQHDEARGQLFERSRLAVGPVPRLAQAVDRRDDRIGAGRQNDPVRLDLDVADLDASRRRDFRVAAMERDALLAHPRRGARALLVVVVGNLEVAPLECCRGVE